MPCRTKLKEEKSQDVTLEVPKDNLLKKLMTPGGETSQAEGEHVRISDEELNKPGLPKPNVAIKSPEDLSVKPKETKNLQAVIDKKEEEDKHPKTIDNPAAETGQKVFEESVALLQKLSKQNEGK